MTRLSYSRTLGKALSPLGFTPGEVGGRRLEKRWIRRRGDVEEAVSLQLSSVAGVTANLWTHNFRTEELLREAIPSEPPLQIVQVGRRIGTLATGYDRWWKNESNGPTELAEMVVAHAPAYFDLFTSLEQQAVRYGRGEPRRDASLSIYLALTLYQMGEKAEACEALAAPPPKRTPASWLPKILAVRDWLGCAPSP